MPRDRRTPSGVVRDPEQYRLPEAEHQRIFETRIRPVLFEEAERVERPVAVIFGGQPGAGKSAAIAVAALELNSRGGAVEIIGDDLRAFHPRYEQLLAVDDQTAAFYTDRDSARWVEKAIAHASENRYSVLVEGTYRNSDVVASTMQRFRGAGYDVDARALAVNERFSMQGIVERYETQRADRGSGRMTTPEAHRAAYEGMPSTIERVEREKLADRLTIYRRGGDVVYSNQLEDGKWKSPPFGRQALEQERSRPLTDDERSEFIKAADRIDALLEAPGRQASPAALQAAAQLRQTVEPPGAARPASAGKDDESAADLKSRIHIHAMAQLQRNFNAVGADSRFDQHNDAELAKVAYFRGCHEKGRALDGMTTDFKAYDEAMVDREKVRQLPEVPDLEGPRVEREKPRSRSDDHGLSM